MLLAFFSKKPLCIFLKVFDNVDDHNELSVKFIMFVFGYNPPVLPVYAINRTIFQASTKTKIIYNNAIKKKFPSRCLNIFLNIIKISGQIQKKHLTQKWGCCSRTG